MFILLKKKYPTFLMAKIGLCDCEPHMFTSLICLVCTSLIKNVTKNEYFSISEVAL